MHELTNPENRSLTKPLNGPLDSTQLAYLWTRMIARYGHRWTSQFGDRPVGAAAAEWADTLTGLNNTELSHGFVVDANRGDDWPPSSTKFRTMCLPPESDAPRTYLGSAPPKRQYTAIESERSKQAAKRELDAMCKKLGINIDLSATP